MNPGAHRLVALSIAIGMAATGCTGGDRLDGSPPPSPGVVPRGGTLRVVIPRHEVSYLTTGPALDPQVDWWIDSWEIFRCCLLRTLLAHEGRRAEDGGDRLHPDLAASMPTVSRDGYTWTFELKRGLTYAPPLDDAPIVAGDIIRALERTARVGSYGFYYSVIEGFDEVVAGDAETISGLEAPNDLTLRITLTKPSGDLGHLFALPATAPIPADPADPTSALGVAENRPRYGRFLIASGPYMVAGSDDLNLSSATAEPLSGYRPRRSLTLVRNPSWQADTDRIREAYVDRIEFAIDVPITRAIRMIESGSADLFLFDNPPPQIPLEEVERFRGDPELGVRVYVEPRDQMRWITINLAVPPLDDVHVRRAINHAIDKERLLEIRGGEHAPILGEVADHVVPNGLENGLLTGYDPYPTDERAARDEMRRSAYDSNGDGRCDHASCDGLLLLTSTGFFPEMVEMADSVRRDLRQIGIHVRVQNVKDFRKAGGRIADPVQKIPMAMFGGWGKDHFNASTYIVPLFSSLPGTPEDVSPNYSLVGATPAQLRAWGYEVTDVPNVNAKIDECLGLIGDAQVHCWAETDQFLMEQVVPWVPYVYEKKVQLVSERVVQYSFDQFSISPALDLIAVDPDDQDPANPG